MSKVAKRLLTFFIGLPLVIAIVFFDFYNHLLLQLAIFAFTFLGANELYNMFSKSTKLFNKALILICTTLIPLVSYLLVIFGLSLDTTFWFFICESIILLGIECLFSKTFENSKSKITLSIMILFYVGVFITFLSKMTILPNSTYIIILFLIQVFMCDSCAWFFGVLFGKSSRGFIAASPNKSLVGFAGGIAGSIFFSCIFKLILPEVFTCSFISISVLAFVTAIAAIIGDLIESVLKRSCDVKDSGNLIPGRGGVLDSIDSILIAAPIFYIAQYFLF